MTTIENIYKEMEILVSQIEGEDAIEEVDIEFVPYEKNTTELLESSSIESYLEKYDEICKDGSAVLECFNFTDSKELGEYIEKEELSFDELKLETAKASCEALKFLIYEAEEEEY